MVISINPYDSKLDQLSMLSNDYTYHLVGLFNASLGQLVITNPGTQAPKASNWNDVINFPAYRLNIDVSRAKETSLASSCRLVWMILTVSVYVFVCENDRVCDHTRVLSLLTAVIRASSRCMWRIAMVESVQPSHASSMYVHQ